MERIRIDIIIHDPLIITFRGKKYLFNECPGYKDYIAQQISESLDLQGDQEITVEFIDD
jgi:hypothetical protein